MKLADFDYTDLKGKQSHRKILITGTPSNKYSGLDVTECNDEEIALFAVEYEKIHNKFLSELDVLQRNSDMKYKYRQFLEPNINNLSTEII